MNPHLKAAFLCALVCAGHEALAAQPTVSEPSMQACLSIRGRAIEYRGDGFFAIWHVGTHHIFSPADAKSADLVCQYFDCESGDRQPALFADFTLCPTEPYHEGAAQPARVERVEHPIVVTDWPPPKSERDYVQDFYEWYAKRVSSDDTNKSWTDMLRLAHWDLSDHLSKLLEEDAVAQSHCGEIIGIDFDPFLFTQDPAKEYEVGAIERNGDRYKAKIYRREGGKLKEKPDVVAEIARSGGRWYFVNFYNTDLGSDLLTILKSPRPQCSAPLKP